jgi:hypothetical protein
MDVRQPSELWTLCQAAHSNSKRWFGTSDPATDIASNMSHMVISLCSEAGNLAGIVKLIDRGELDPKDAHAYYEMVMTLTDVFMYVLNISALLRCDLQKAYDQKVIANERRFMEDNKIHKPPEPGWRSVEYLGEKE